MSDRTLARWSPAGPGGAERLEWLTLDRQGRPRGDLSSGAPADLRRQTRRNRLTLLLDGARVTLTAIDLPPGNRRRAQEALPFALEDQVAADIDELHFALGPRDALGLTGAAVVDRAWLRERIEPLRNAGLEPHALAPEPLLLPFAAGSWSLFAEPPVDAAPGRVHLRTGPAQACTLERDGAPEVLRRLSREYGLEAPPPLLAWQCDPSLREALEQTGFEVVAQPAPPAGLLGLCAGQATGRPVYDLRGAVELEEERTEGQDWTLPVAWGALALALILNTGIQAWQFRGLSAIEAEKRALVEGLFREAFPDVTRVVDPLVQAQRKLDERRRAQGSGDAFLDMLFTAGSAIARSPGLRPNGIDYRQGVLAMQLKAGSLAEVEGLKQGIERDGRFTTEILSADSGADGVEARIKIQVRGQ